MNRKILAVTASVAVCLAISGANAATVNLTLALDPGAPGCNGCTLSGPGTYNLFAESSLSDNSGIVGYGISVQNVTSLLHRAPRVNSSETPDGDIFPAGFTLLRSGNNQVANGTGFLFGAGQDTVTPTPYLIQGFGQTGNLFTALIPPENTNGGIIQPEWGAKLLLAEGMYNPSGEAPFIDFANVDVFVNVIVGSGVERANFGGGPDPVVNDLALDPIDVIGGMSMGTVTGSDVDTWDPAVEFVSYTPNYLAGPNPPDTHGDPIWDPATQKFSWDATGAYPGDYVWRVTGSNGQGSDTGLVSVALRVPEPTSLLLFGLAIAGFAGCRRK